MAKNNKFSNRRGSRIRIITDRDYLVVDAWSRKHNWGDHMLVDDCVTAILWDFENIYNYILKGDKIARRWFKKKAGDITLLCGLKLSEFFLDNGKIDYKKAEKYDNIKKI